MSSLTRRMQIRGMKRLGYVRTKFRFAKNAKGEEQKIRVARGGMIMNANDERVGYSWPRRAVV